MRLDLGMTSHIVNDHLFFVVTILNSTFEGQLHFENQINLLVS